MIEEVTVVYKKVADKWEVTASTIDGVITTSIGDSLEGIISISDVVVAELFALTTMPVPPASE